MWFAAQLHDKGLISDSQFVEAAKRQIRDRIPIGRLALETRMLTLHQVAEVFAAQADEQKPFGRIAVDRGFLREHDLAHLLMVQSDRTPSMANCLVELGAIDQDVLDEELAKARRQAADDPKVLCAAKDML